MTTKEKIQFLLDKGLSISLIAKISNYHPSTLSKWLSEKISVSEKLEKNINQSLLVFVEELQKIKEGD
jgi:transcriptional regulator with XRE-family HTH domain